MPAQLLLSNQSADFHGFPGFLERNMMASDKFVMPYPAPFVVWRTSPNGDAAFAVVTHVHRNAIDVLVFPQESRVGVPKTGVRYAADPWHKINGLDPSAGVWEPTSETTLIETLRDELDGLVREIEDLKVLFNAKK